MPGNHTRTRFFSTTQIPGNYGLLPMKLRVGLYRNDPKANVRKFVPYLRQCRMPFRLVHRHDLAAVRPGDFDVLLLHGGWYGIDRIPGQNQSDKHETSKTKDCAPAARRFVRAGDSAMHRLELINDRPPILAGNYGDGRVAAISSHPEERSPAAAGLLKNALLWAAHQSPRPA